jgi:hypothetical protein
MRLGKRGLTALTGVAVLVASLSPLVHAQTTAPAKTDSATTTKPASGKATTTTKPAATATKPSTTKSPTTTTPGTSTRAPGKTTSTAPAKSATTTAKPGTAPKATAPAPVKPAASTAASQPAPVTPPKPPATIAPAPPPPQATPLRDTTPTASALPGAPAPVPVPGLSFRQRHPLVGGFLTGLLGAGLADALLGEDVPEAPPGKGLPPGNVLEPVAAGLATAEMTGQLLRLAFFGALVALAVMLYRRRALTASASVAARARSAPGLSAWDDLDRSLPEPEPASLGRPDDLKAIADEQDFADILLVVQAAWSEGDVMAMRSHITPDMATYFDRRLAQNIDNGIENRVVDVSNVRVERLSDWEEDGLHYAKARMRWRALDYIIDMSKLPDEPGYIIDGSPEKPLDCEEVWTFVKSPDGAWVLCEVEQGA